MLRSRSPWMQQFRPWVAAGALFFSLPACAPHDDDPVEAANTPAPSVADNEHTMTTTTTPKLENTPAPPTDPTPPPVIDPPKPVLDPPPAPVIDPPKPVIDPPPPPVIDPPKPTPTPEPAPTPPPEPKPDPKPVDVSVTGFETGTAVGLDGHVTDPKTVFAAADTVRLAVLAEGASRVIKLGVRWVGPDGAQISEDVQDVTLTGPMAVPFSLADPKGLALGAYKAEIRIEGWLASTAEFEVR